MRDGRGPVLWTQGQLEVDPGASHQILPHQLLAMRVVEGQDGNIRVYFLR